MADDAAADAAELFEVAAVLVEGGLEVSVAGRSGLVVAMFVLVGMFQRFYGSVRNQSCWSLRQGRLTLMAWVIVANLSALERCDGFDALFCSQPNVRS